MKITRRDFLKLSSLLTTALFSTGLFIIEGCKSIPDKLKGTKKIAGICPFCSMGCGIIASVRQEKLINIEGNPEHPINEGKLCAKGSAVFQLSKINKKRLDKILYRAPYASEWKEISWDEALKKIAKNIKNTRDNTFVESEGNTAVNRTTGIAVMGGDQLTNEEAYLLSKMSRLLGITHLYNESGLPRSGPATALSSTLGYSAMSNHWTDIQNSDVVLIIGSNPIENHPVSIKHILKSKENGGTIIHIDPRFTRTSSIADYYAPIRPGTDIAFIGGIINFAIQNDRIQVEYITEYTNASYIVNSDYDFQNGFFSGFKNGKYNNDTWDYERDKKDVPRTDKSLNSRNTVFQIIKTHFSRYTAHAVSSATGCPAETFLKIADLFTSTYKPGKAAGILFSSGITQHTTGSQNIRALAILQLLLGNIGIKGGGINTLNSGSNEQGCMDNGLCSDFLPGYLPAPDVKNHPDINSYIKNTTSITNDPMSINSLSRRNIYLINLLKSYYGENAVKKTYFCYNWLPKISKHHQTDIFKEILKGSIRGVIIAGANPSLTIPNSNVKNKALENLEWMAMTDIFENETSVFWKRDGASPEKIKTEVFLLPSASSIEKNGSITNSGRWVQWMDKIANSPGEAKPDLWIFDSIFKSTREVIKSDMNTFFPEPIIASNWSYSNRKDYTDPNIVAQEINGYYSDTGKLISESLNLTDNGSTNSGNWLYCGSYTEAGNMMKRKKKDDPDRLKLFPKWAWSWPNNVRILYNRAGVNRKGIPWSDDKHIIKWDDAWYGDIADGGRQFGPGEKNPFAILPEGTARLFDRDIFDGPLPEHYEPIESPANNLFNLIQHNPCLPINNKYQNKNRGNKYPHIATTYKITETWKPGIMTENMPWIAELVPDIFCEISLSLGEANGINYGDRIRIISKRGSITARCLVTDRIQPLTINGREIEIVAIVINSGHENISNTITEIIHDIGDPTTNIPEIKAFLVDIKGI